MRATKKECVELQEKLKIVEHMKKQALEEKSSAEDECNGFKTQNEEFIAKNLVLERKLREKDVQIAALNTKLEDGKKTVEGNWNKVSDAANNLRHTMNQGLRSVTHDSTPERMTLNIKDSTVIFLETPKSNQNQCTVSQYTTANERFSSPGSNLTQEAFFSIINQVNTIKDTVLFKGASSNGSSGTSNMEEQYQAKLTSLQNEKSTVEQKERETYKAGY